MRILPANSVGRWIFIFVIWLCICLSFLFCAVIFCRFLIRRGWLDPEPTWKVEKRHFASTWVIFVHFFVHCFLMLFAFFGISQMGTGRHLFGIIFAFPNQSDKEMTIKYNKNHNTNPKWQPEWQNSYFWFSNVCRPKKFLRLFYSVWVWIYALDGGGKSIGHHNLPLRVWILDYPRVQG